MSVLRVDILCMSCVDVSHLVISNINRLDYESNIIISNYDYTIQGYV